MIEITDINTNEVNYKLSGDYEIQTGNQLLITKIDTGAVVYYQTQTTYAQCHKIPDDIIKESGDYIFQITSIPNGGCDVQKKFIEVSFEFKGCKHGIGDIVCVNRKIQVKYQGFEVFSDTIANVGKIISTSQ